MAVLLKPPLGAVAGLAAAIGAATCAVPARAEPAGAALFATHCAECHSVREGKDKKGPSLYAIVGRPAGANPGFVYSEALRKSGLTWTAESLGSYIAAPGQRVPGGKMKFDGLPSAAERSELIAYLASLSAPR